MTNEPPILTNEGAVLAFLRAHPGWRSWHEIYSAIYWIDFDTLDAALDALTEARVLEFDACELWRVRP